MIYLSKNRPVKLIIAGSRSIVNMNFLWAALRWHRIDRDMITEVVSGGARGVDHLGERFAQQNGIPLRIFPADWEKYGKAAGSIRNNQMALYADVLLAVWDGDSRGTQDMIAAMCRCHKLNYMYPAWEDGASGSIFDSK